MKISHGWLEDFVGLDPAAWTPERVAEVLTDLGLEVEHVHNPTTRLDRIVVGKVVTCEPHPKADKLSVCTVDAGEPDLRTIVCGAPNVAAGQTVIVALDGAVIPSAGFTIGKRMLRGVESNGMICSAAELELGEDSGGIVVLGNRKPETGNQKLETGNLEPGTPIAEALGLSVVYDIGITPNRADCLSHIGIARELRAYMHVHAENGERRTENGEQNAENGERRTENGTEAELIVRVEATSLAPIYAIQRITGVRVGPSPEWMQNRLREAGLRPRNVIVDVTNYVNMELGQPLHAFDTSKLREERIVVREAGAVQEFVTLDGKMRTLQPDMLMICDGVGPVAIAGVMGGGNSEIDDDTTDISLESAWFEPRSIRRTARLLGLSTDASYRFERGVDPGGVLTALNRATELIVELAGGSPVAQEVVNNWQTSMAPIRVRYERMRMINGIDVDDAMIRRMFEAIDCEIVKVDGDACEVIPPTWRVDLAAEIDFAEEVMRLHGVNNVPESLKALVHLSGALLPSEVRAAGGSAGLQHRHDLRTILRSRGYADVVTAVLGPVTSDEQPVTLKNALGVEYSVMRSSLLPGLLGTVAHNLNHGAPTIRLVEIGNVFVRDEGAELGVRQREQLALVMCGNEDEHWSSEGRLLDLYDLMADVEAVAGRRLDRKRVSQSSASIWSVNAIDLYVGSVMVGTAGVLNADRCAVLGVERTVVAAELDLRLMESAGVQASRYVAVSPFPTVRRDVAFVVDEAVSADDLLNVVDRAAEPPYLGASIFDVFRDERQIGPGRKSVGIALRFGANDRTLVDADVERSVRAIVTAASQRLGATLRGTGV
jgi:phenylalanyl-tRNA synthetase beta chain